MAKSSYEYVKSFEQPLVLLPNCWIVLRLDGRGFGKFTKEHNYAKPLDERGQRLMNHCARQVLAGLQGEALLASGHSDEFSFVLRPETTLWSRRADKLTTQAASMFTGAFVLGWPLFFADVPLRRAPVFDARAVLYPSVQNVRDYLSWRQVDCHINHLYNTAFWSLVLRAGMSETDAHQRLSGTSSADKNELLFGQFNINYNDQPPLFKRPSVVFRSVVEKLTVNPKTGQTRTTKKPTLVEINDDLIQDRPFWSTHFPSMLLSPTSQPSSSTASSQSSSSTASSQSSSLTSDDS